MANEDTILRPGDMMVKVVLRQPAVIGAQPTIEIQVEGVNSPFDGIRMLRVAEDRMRNDAEAAIQQILAQMPQPVRLAGVN